MQRVSALLPLWDKSNANSNSNFTSKKTADGGRSGGALIKVFSWADKIASPKGLTTPVSPSSKIGREAYWPTTLDRECDKAARILKSFCTDGFLAQDGAESVPTSPTSPRFPVTPTTGAPPLPPRPSLKKIPPRIIQDAVGLAIFSCMRSGLWMSGSGGSGILIARKADGTWSPPSGILLHTAALGFVIGVDIYDCVLVINSVAALEMFTRPRVTLGSDVPLSVGPLISAGLLENDVRWKELNNSVLTYLKARGQHQGVRLDGSLVTERGNENERFYAGNVDVLDILAGNVRKSIPEIMPLFEAIKAAEGRSDFDPATMDMLSQQPAPGDAVIETPTLSPVSPKATQFGLPDAADPDPFGVIALEMAGLEIREAGTRLRPTSTQFEYSPSPTSPLFSKFNRQSTDTYLTRSNRGSYMSSRTQGTNMTDAYTQTDVAGTPDTTLSPSHSDDGRDQVGSETALPVAGPPHDEVDYTKVDMTAIKHLSEESLANDNNASGVEVEESEIHDSTARPDAHEEVVVPDKIEKSGETRDEANASGHDVEDERDEDADDEEDEEDEEDEPVIYEVATASQPARATIMSSQVTQVIQAKGSLVTIPKRIPPPLPLRSPARNSRSAKSDFGDVSSVVGSPLRHSFQSAQTEPSFPVTVRGGDLHWTTSTEHVAEEEPTAKSGDEAASAGAGDKEETSAAGHRRHPSSISATIEKRMSRDSTPETPSTPQATEAASSGDDSERGPQTPKVEDDFRRPREPVPSSGRDNGTEDLGKTDNEVKVDLESSHIDPSAITVA